MREDTSRLVRWTAALVVTATGIDKTYEAITWGIPGEGAATFTDFRAGPGRGRDAASRSAFTSDPRRGGK